jgi:S1-C subfamily serine protease
MRRIWLIFAQAVTVCLAILFVVVTLRPDWLPRGEKQIVTVGPSALPLARGQGQGVAAPGSYSDAVALAAPAVVNIHTTKRIVAPRIALPPDPALRKFFEQMPGYKQQQQATSLGSGVIVSAAGHIVTNFHVINGADEILVALHDGRQTSAKVIGVDPDSDLAVLKIQLPALHALGFMTDEMPRVGDVVLAIGNPFGVGQTITMGIVSALGRQGLGINTYENFIQTDAAINPGNSGGALIDTLGRLVGINTAIYSKTGGSLGIGFAIPAGAAQKVLEQIIAHGHVKRGWLGIEPQDMTADLAKGGLRVGDIVQTMDGRPVGDTPKLMARIAAKEPGEKIELGVYRNGKTQSLSVVAGLRPVRPQ